MTATGFESEVREGILIRDAERCSMEGAEGCPGQTQRALDGGHRLNRGVGGDPRPLVNSPANGCAQHRVCNLRLEKNAEFAEEGRRRGCKLDHSGDDLDAIVSTPFWSVFWGQWLVLRPGGAYLTGDTGRTRDARAGRVVGSEASGFAILWDRVWSPEKTVFEATGASA